MTFKAEPIEQIVSGQVASGQIASGQVEKPVLETETETKTKMDTDTEIEAPRKTQTVTAPAEPVAHTFLLEPSLTVNEAGPESISQCRALIVEDIRSNQDVIAVMLETAGVQYVPVDSGESALNVLQTQGFDFILMDIHMPGMDGIETTRRIRAGNQAWSDIPIIALTADAAAENSAACMAAGADMFLTKPVKAKDLLSAIETVTQQSFDQTETGLVQLSKRA